MRGLLLRARVAFVPAPSAAASFHSSAARLSQRGAAFKKISPRRPVKQVDGVPWWLVRKREEFEKRQDARVVMDSLREQKVIPFQIPNRQAWVYSLEEREALGIVKLNDEIWNQDLRKDIVHRVVVWHRARQRQGTHKEKGRHEVRGGGIKPRPQKGSGRARMGSIRSPMNRGGGAALPRRPRDYSFPLPAKILSKSLQICLTAKFLEGNMYVIDSPSLPSHKTQPLVDILADKWNLYDAEDRQMRRLCVITGAGELDPNLALAARNLRWVDFFPAYSANTWDVIRREVVMVTRQGLEELEARLLAPFYHHRSRINFVNDTVPKQSDGLPEILPPLTPWEQKQLAPKEPRRVDISRPWLLVKDPVTGELREKSRKRPWSTTVPIYKRGR